jgi:hypothetical protein
MNAHGSSPRWDVGDEVVTRGTGSVLRDFVVSTAVSLVVFSSLMAFETQRGALREFAFSSPPRAVVEILRIPRKARAPVSRRDSPIDGTDSRIGMSTARLAEIFPRLFVPVPVDDETDDPPFFLS